MSSSNGVRRALTALAAGATAVALAGCGAGDAPSTPPAPVSPAVQPPTVVPGTTPPAAPELEMGKNVNVGGLHVQVVSRKAVQTVSRIPGEGAGPAVLFEVELTNTSGRPYSTAQWEINLLDAEGQAASPYTTDPATPLPATIAPKTSQTARFVFLVPQDARSRMRLSISTVAGQRGVVFTGGIG